MKQHGGNIQAFSRQHNRSLDDIIDFSANINPLGMSQVFKSKVEDMFQAALHYPDPTYFKLKAAIADFESVDPKHIVLGNGAIECIYIIAECLRHKHVMVQAPTFVEYEQAFRKYNTEVSYYKLSGDFQTNIEDYLKAIPESVDTLVICNPNNPTGVKIKHDAMCNLVRETRKRNITLIVDEAFMDFATVEESVIELIEDNDHIIILKSLTKFFGMPGLRLGYLLTSNKSWLENIENYRIPWSINTIVEHCAIEAIADKSYIEATRTFVIKERTWLSGALSSLGIEALKSEGNYLFFKSLVDLDERLIPYDIMIRNCENYVGLEKGYFRVAVKKHHENVKLVESLKEILWKS